MNGTVCEATKYIEALRTLLSGMKGLAQAQLFVVPPLTALGAVKRLSSGLFWIGAQNMHWAECGAFTGEISAPMLREAGADLVELGHAERRLHFNETDETVSLKVDTALRHGLRPLVCVGDDSKGRGKAEDAVARQLRIAFRATPPESAGRLMVAYEPAWAIGEAGTSATPGEAAAMHRHIRSVLREMFGTGASLIPVLYGGSVTPLNAGGLLREGEADGLFVGRAAWTANGFAEVIRASLEARGK
jgi:triosephosphate isomerase